MHNYYIFIGLIIIIIIFTGFIINTKRDKDNEKQINHYFIIVKNSQIDIEWVIRSINYKNWLKGRQRKISVFDFDSKDDSIAILEKMTYPNKKIDNLYINQTNREYLLNTKINESRKKGEKQLIFNLIDKNKKKIIN